ncbi:uncharacterized protein [Neodiprion pinetum]|uniref:uncharacterized protein isoform X1 n=1 Tax=Neodiprion pinetum TaxID=441929 RepID=UPI001EDFAD39|nr:uncharacterized protein LOC124213358 isoform X1 [Neodiprion pinetum]
MYISTLYLGSVLDQRLWRFANRSSLTALTNDHGTRGVQGKGTECRTAISTSKAIAGLISALFYIAAAISPAVVQYNVSEYVANIDIDLQARAVAALEAEKHAYQSRTWLEDRIGPDGSPCRVRPERPCPPSMYRAPSGACNNVRHPAWGARGSPMLRLIGPAYADGISKPRQSVGTHALPLPFDVVSSLRRDSAHHEGLASLAGVWAELLLRDIAETMNPKGIDCCGVNGPNHAECYSTWSENGGSEVCRNYTRSLPTLTATSCKFETREQMNAVSGYLDGSDLYGNTDQDLHAIRTYSHGRVSLAACKKCEDGTALGALYRTLFLEHNRLADGLAEVNDHWEDAKVFLEARRIVISELQHVTINEFVPSILGEAAFVNADLKPVRSGFYSGYSSTNRGGVFDSVALGALRALLSLNNGSVSLEDLLARPARQVSLRIPGVDNGDWDEAERAIHAARDHGVPGYPHFVSYCSGNDRMINFTDFEYTMSEDDVEGLRGLYATAEDVDLLVGGTFEKPTEAAAVGPTFGCLLREQFVKLRNSDRFWYENDLPPSGLTAEQLAEVRRVSLAGIICKNTGIAKIQPMAFIQQDPYLNVKINCDQHGIADLAAWREHPTPDMISDNSMASVVAKEVTSELTPEVIANAVRKAEQDLVVRKQLEYNAWLEQKTADPKSPIGTAASFSKASKDALLLANSSILFELATNEIINGAHGLRRRKRQIFDSSDNVLGFPNNEFSDILQTVDISSFLQSQTTPDELDCPPDDSPCDPSSPFRTLSGHCNNLRNPKLGTALTTFARLLPPIYEDGVSKPRMNSITGIPLPNPRVISTVIHPDISNLHNRYTLMVMQFAQFVDHDMTMTPIHKGFHESIPSCRSCDSARTVHPECNPFPIPPGDHFYPTVNVSSGARLCIPSMRSLPGQQQLGPREQINQNTAFLDGSVIYGENDCVCQVLRTFNGRMNITRHPNRGKDLLPQTATHPECKTRSGYCFIGGDGRVSEQPALAVMHTLWVREHNRIMEGLRQVNPHWDGEKLFQHSRRIISAMLQHLVYNEFLPRILGWNAVSLYGLKLLPQGYYKEYSPTCNPSVLNEFAAAAFRIGHSLLRPHLPRMDSNFQNIDPPILLRDGFFNPDMLYDPGMVDEMIRGLVSTPMETLDQFITGEVTNHLFENRRIPHSGVDLIALNVQRARDHGIPSYNNYRALCNLKRATTFEDLSREMAPEVIARLKRIYASVDDIDLFPGGMSERPLQGGLVGPTFACIIAIQFRQSRKCDRFWYETDDPNIRFTEHQLAEIRKTTLSKVICENMDQHQDMQRAAFDLPSNFLNPRVPCSSMPHMDFSAWRETSHGCQIGSRNVAVGESGFPTPCTSCVCTAEGTQCASLRVTDCNQLLREASREAILRDDVCTAQCGFVLAASEASARLQFPNSNAFRGFPSPGNNLRNLPTAATFNGFKLPDLSQFIG